MQDGQQQPGWVFRPGEQPGVADNTPGAAPQLLPSQVMDTPPPQSEVVPSFEPANGNHVEWSASEYVANPKSAGWFGILALGSIVLAAGIFLVSRDIISTVVVLVVGLLFGVFAARQPRTLSYAIDSRGIQAGTKFYPYNMFKSFSQSRDRAVSYISLLPMRRFMPPLVIHYGPEDEERILNTLADYIPYEERHVDIMDTISKKIKF